MKRIALTVISRITRGLKKRAEGGINMFTTTPSVFISWLERYVRKLAIILIAVFVISTFALAQDLDMDCRPIQSIPPQCQQISRDLAAREEFFSSKIELLKDQLVDALVSQKQRLRDQIKALETQRDHDRQLAQLKDQLQACRARYDPTPRRPVEASELDAILVGQAQVNTADSRAKGPYFVNLNLAIRFSKNRCGITITSFPTIMFNAMGGTLAVEITMSSGGDGKFFPISGQIEIPITLHFHYDKIGASDDDVSMTLTTENSVSRTGAFNLNGSRMQTANGTNLFGNVTIVAGTEFRNGSLGGKDGGFIISGQISPPLQPPPPRLRQCPAGRKCCERSADGSCTRCVANNMQCP
jgi:hypothetical protein